MTAGSVAVSILAAVGVGALLVLAIKGASVWDRKRADADESYRMSDGWLRALRRRGLL